MADADMAPERSRRQSLVLNPTPKSSLPPVALTQMAVQGNRTAPSAP